MPFVSCSTFNTSQAVQDAAIAALQAGGGVTPTSVAAAVNGMTPAQLAAMCAKLNCAPTAAALTTSLLSLPGSGTSGNVLTIVGGVPVWQAPVAGAAATVPATGITAGAIGAGVTLPATQLTGIIPAANLPSYVDDVLEFANLAAFPAAGEAGKIYVTADTNKVYRWTGSAYAEMSAGSGAAATVPATGITAGAIGAGVTLPATQVTGFDAAALAAIPVATDTVQGKVALNLGTSLPADASNATDALTAAGLNAMLTATPSNAVQAAVNAASVLNPAQYGTLAGVGAPTAAPTAANPATELTNANGEVFRWNGTSWYLSGNGYFNSVSFTNPAYNGASDRIGSIYLPRPGDVLVNFWWSNKNAAATTAAAHFFLRAISNPPDQFLNSIPAGQKSVISGSAVFKHASVGVDLYYYDTGALSDFSLPNAPAYISIKYLT